jgi:hypothetical protein
MLSKEIEVVHKVSPNEEKPRANGSTAEFSQTLRRINTNNLQTCS